MAHGTGSTAVIGGGLGGLSAAIRLAFQGRRVTLFEQADVCGGKAGLLVRDGFTFDTGPSLLTLPEVFDNLFASCGRDRRDYLSFIPLSPLTGYWFDDGTCFASDRVDAFTDTLTGNLEVSETQVRGFFDYARNIYETAGGIFLTNSLHEPATYRSRQVLASLLRIGRIDPFRTMEQGIRRFFTDPRAVQLFCRYATYNGSDPYQVPAALNNIAYVEHGLGGYAVDGGIYAVVNALVALAEELGVEIRTSSRVEEVKTSGGNISGVRAGGTSYQCDTVVSGIDVLQLYDLLDDREAPQAARFRSLAPSTSGAVFYWGMDRQFSEMGVHSVFFSRDYKAEFSQLHGEFRLPEDPTVYVNITSKVNSEHAPPGGENWFVLINAPPDDGRDWEALLPDLRQRVIRRISKGLGTDISKHIKAEETLTPRQIAEGTGSFRGSLYGISSNSRAAAFLRHPNRSKRWKGLYLCGGSVHPGGGMPLALLSGKIAAELIRRYES